MNLARIATSQTSWMFPRKLSKARRACWETANSRRRESARAFGFVEGIVATFQSESMIAKAVNSRSVSIAMITAVEPVGLAVVANTAAKKLVEDDTCLV